MEVVPQEDKFTPLKGQSTTSDSSLNRCVSFLIAESQEFLYLCLLYGETIRNKHSTDQKQHAVTNKINDTTVWKSAKYSDDAELLLHLNTQ